MNILNRINKLEQMPRPGRSPYCRCNGEGPFYDVYTHDLTEDAEVNHAIPTKTGEPMRDDLETCITCGKPINARRFVVQICDASTPKHLLRDSAKFDISNTQEIS